MRIFLLEFDNFEFIGLTVSECCDSSKHLRYKSDRSYWVYLSDLSTFDIKEENSPYYFNSSGANNNKCNNSNARNDLIDILEIFGCAAGCTKIAIRRRLRCGKNVDLVSGLDLSRPADAQHLIDDVRLRKPVVVIGGPPCTAFAVLSKLNRHLHPESYARSRRTGLVLARIMARIMKMQIDGGRYFVVENPRGSELWKLVKSIAIYALRCVGCIDFPQCSLGLVSPEVEPLLKWTTLWSNSKLILMMFVGLQCMHSKHGVIKSTFHGVSRSSWSAVWPLEMYRRIISGCQAQIRVH